MDSSSTSPRGVTRSCTLGLRNSSPADPLLDDAAGLGERRDVASNGCPALEAASRAPARRPRHAPRGVTGGGEGRRSTSALPSPATPSLSLTITSWTVGRCGPQPREWRRGRRRSSAGPRADRVTDALLGEQPAAAGLRTQREEARVGAVQRDAQGQREVPLEGRGVVRDQVGPLAVGDERRDLASSRGRSSSFAVERAQRGVVDATPGTAGPGRGWG